MESSGGGIGAIIGIVIYLAIIILMVVSWWKIFTKAGKPGWAILVPIYNVVVMLQICQKPVWWIILLFVPIVNFIILILVMVALAQAFGKGVGFALGMIFLGIVFVPMLGFGSSKYVGEAAPAAA